MTPLPYPLGPYLLIHTVGEGGSAVVYLALKRNEPYLVKCLKPERAWNKVYLESFLREVHISTALRHKNVVPFVDSGRVNSSYFAVMPFDAGVTAAELLRICEVSGRRPPLPLALYIVSEAAEALRYVHCTRVFPHSDSTLFHGDLSPDNLLLTDEGLVKLTDFGSAGQESFADGASVHYGKLAYLPAEVARDRAVNSATDVYSLAAVAFHLLFGQRPFEGRTLTELRNSVSRHDVPRLDASALVRSGRDVMRLRILFNKALNKNPSLRYTDVEAFERDFFSLGFLSPPSDSPDMARELFPEALWESMVDLRSTWTLQINRYREGSRTTQKLINRFASTGVESILARENLRKHPRMRMKEDVCTAEVVSQDMAWKSTCSVVELGEGGLMVRWKALPSRTGQNHRLILNLPDEGPPLSLSGEVRYEITHFGRAYVGLRFTDLPRQAGDRISAIVRRHLSYESTLKGAKPAGENAKTEVIEVVFVTEQDWRREFEQNIVHGGIFVRSSEPRANDEEVIVRISLPGRDLRMELRGRVVFCQPITGPEEEMRKHSLGIHLDLDEAARRSIFQTL